MDNSNTKCKEGAEKCVKILVTLSILGVGFWMGFQIYWVVIVKKKTAKAKKLVKLDKLYVGFVILIIYLPILSVLFMVGELFFGLLGIALAIGGSAIAIYLEMRRGRGQVEGMLDYLKNSAMGNVDEKIAVLYMHANNVKHWRKSGIDIDSMVSQISNDISSIARVKNKMSWEQWKELHRALRILIETMQKNNFDINEIEDIRTALK